MYYQVEKNPCAIETIGAEVAPCAIKVKNALCAIGTIRAEVIPCAIKVNEAYVLLRLLGLK